MKITYLLGNGFDLHFGLRTSYNDFLDFLERHKETYFQNEQKDVYSRFLEYKKQDVTWSDMEVALGKFSAKFICDKTAEGYEQDKEKYLKFLRIIQNALVHYFTIINNKNFQLFDGKEEFKEQLYDFAFGKDQKDIDQENEFRVITFNYTQTLNKILHYSKEKKICLKNNSFLVDVQHIHGIVPKPIGDCVIFGVSDKEQIENPAFREDEAVQKQIIKTRWNEIICDNRRDETNFRVNLFHKYIEDADIICTYGISFGETDRNWWNEICDKLLKDKETYLQIYAYNRDGGNQFADFAEKVKNGFLNAADSGRCEKFSKEQKTKLRKHIFVAEDSFVEANAQKAYGTIAFENINRRQKVMHAIREILEKQGLIEVYPTRLMSANDADDDGCASDLFKSNAKSPYGNQLYLANTSQYVLETYMSSLARQEGINGFFSILPCYRNMKESKPTCLSEYWQLEVEWCKSKELSMAEAKDKCDNFRLALIEKMNEIYASTFKEGARDWAWCDSPESDAWLYTSKEDGYELFSLGIRKDTIGFGMGIERFMMYYFNKRDILSVCDLTDSNSELSRKYIENVSAKKEK